MASKKFLDGIPPEEGVKYQLVTGGDNKTTITNITNWSQTPTEMRANDFIQGMVLLCDHTKVGVTHNFTNPNDVVGMIRVKVDAGQEVEDGDLFTFNNSPLTVIGEIPEMSEGEYIIATIDGSTINFKQGGAALNFKVVGGTTAPQNPVENTIWVNTDISMGEYQFSNAQPPNRISGGALTNGDVWVKTANQSPVKFNALKKNSLMVYPVAAYQMSGTTFLRKEVKIFQGGEWKSLSLYLYNKGVFAPGQSLTILNTNGGSYSQAADHINVTLGGNYYKYLYFSSPVDLSNAATIRMTFKSNANYNNTGAEIYDIGVSLFVNSSPSTNWTAPNVKQKQLNIGQVYTLSLDVSALQGMQYIMPMLANAQGSFGTINVDIYSIEVM